MGAISKIYKGAIKLIDSTPLVGVTNVEKKEQLKACLLVKLGCLNPAGNVKDRVGEAMVEGAGRTGRLEPGSVITEPASSNTGIGLAVASAVRGYRVILTMPNTMSVERRNILKAYRVKIVLTPGKRGVSGAIEKAEELAKKIPGGFIPGQFDDPVNSRAHMEGTGPEIRRDTGGQIDIFMASVGTGGILAGTGTYLKEKNPRIKVIAVEPSTSVVLSGGDADPHRIQRIGAGFVPKVLDTRVYGEIITAGNEVPFATTKMLARTEGLLTDISSGAALYAGVEVARRPENEGKTIAALLPNSEDRYYFAALFME